MKFVVTFLVCIILSLACSSRKEAEVKQVVQAEEDAQISFKKPKGIVFDVAKVDVADSLLRTDSASLVIENKLDKEVLYFPEEQANYLIVNCPNNGLIQTIQECYDNHRPLILTPDIIWLAICQGVSIHINENYNSLKNIIFLETKPDSILVRNDSLMHGGKYWKSLIDSISNKTKLYTRDNYYDFFVSEFSTTTNIEKTAYQIALLESYKKGFKYIGESGCGIPSILIAGNKNDWKSIKSKLRNLDQIGLTEWRRNLEPIIHQFMLASDGKVNVEFWQDIYKNATEYNAFYISGWIIKFFPYVKELESEGVYDEKLGLSRIGEYLRPNPFLSGDKYLLSTLSTDNFPSGLSKINITWHNYFINITKEMEVYSGFFGVKQYPDKSLEPLISWAICYADAPKVNYELEEMVDQQLNHTPDYWSPHLAKTLKDSAVYNMKVHKTQAQSREYVRSLLLDSIQNHEEFNTIDFSKDTVELTILTNGSVGYVRIKGENVDPYFEEFIENILITLPEKWFPALASPLEVFDDILDGDAIEYYENLKVRVNSKVLINF